MGKIKQFWSEHTKLITFLLCILIFLSVCGPFGYFANLDFSIFAKDGTKEMTKDDIQVMATESAPSMQELRKYIGHGDYSTIDGTNEYRYYVETEEFIVYGVAKDKTSPLTLLVYTDMSTGEQTVLFPKE